MRPAWGPRHLLACAEALMNHLIHGPFDNAGAEGPDLARVVPEAEAAWRLLGVTAMPETGASCAPVITTMGEPRFGVDTEANMGSSCQPP
jgi:hypothetical protein